MAEQDISEITQTGPDSNTAAQTSNIAPVHGLSFV